MDSFIIDGKLDNLFLQCSFDHVLALKLPDIALFYIVKTRGLYVLANFVVLVLAS